MGWFGNDYCIGIFWNIFIGNYVEGLDCYIKIFEGGYCGGDFFWFVIEG